MYSRTRKMSNQYSRPYVRGLHIIVLTLSIISVYEFISLNTQSTLVTSFNDQLSKSMVECELNKKDLMKKLEVAVEERKSADESRNELELQLRGSKQDKKDSNELEVMKKQMSITQQQIERLKSDLQNRGRHSVIEK